jgi:acyl-CoA synthetase (AMP-forming)/AMP-acid ligase II
MADLEAIEARLTGPGGPFEIVVEDVLGTRMPVFKNRLRSLRALLEQSAAQGEKEYLVYEDRRISYAEHLRSVASVARALRERFGVQKGDRVAILAANCPEWIISFWAAQALGAVAVGLNGWWAGDEIAYGVRDCEPKVLIADRRRLERASASVLGVPIVEIETEFEKLVSHDSAATLPDVEIAEDDPAAILYTSGTTGRPKGAINTQRNILALVGIQFFHGARMMLAAAADGHRPVGPPRLTSALVTTPLFHVSGLYTGAIMMLASGAKTVWRGGRFDPEDAMRLIAREQVTSWGPMGTMAYRVVHHPEVAKYDLSSIVSIGSGGAPTSPELQEKIRATFPSARASFGLGYGLTECTALATLSFGEDLARHPHSAGKPLPTVQIEIRDAGGRAVPDGETGEIHVRSPLVMAGYWRNPLASAEAIVAERWLRTGDVGLLEDGRLYINSRARDLILRGAENIYPVEIEQRLEAHPDVLEAAVVGVDHEALGQEVKAILVLRPGAQATPDRLSRWVGETLAAFKVPAHWELRAEPLPRNATGKVLKNVLTGSAENPFVAE